MTLISPSAKMQIAKKDRCCNWPLAVWPCFCLLQICKYGNGYTQIWTLQKSKGENTDAAIGNLQCDLTFAACKYANMETGKSKYAPCKKSKGENTDAAIGHLQSDLAFAACNKWKLVNANMNLAKKQRRKYRCCNWPFTEWPCFCHLLLRRLCCDTSSHYHRQHCKLQIVNCTKIFKMQNIYVKEKNTYLKKR